MRNITASAAIQPSVNREPVFGRAGRMEMTAATRVELDDAVSFYESRAKGLGLDLVEKIRDAVGKIQRNPEAWPPHRRSGFRKLFAERFPYTIFYLELPGIIWIVAIAHASRRPDYWSKRRCL